MHFNPGGCMYSYFDTHCDTLNKILSKNISLDDEKLHINYKTLSPYKKRVQCFALFNDKTLKIQDYFDASEYFEKLCRKDGRIVLCKNMYQTDNALREGKICAILTAEALGNTVDLKEKHVYMLKKSGYLMAGLVWNDNNPICSGCYGKNTGLTLWGEKILKAMEKASIIPDLSHMSPKSLEDTCSVFCKSPIASHSNIKSICNHKRNISDKNMQIIIKKGGVVGINFYPPFVGKEENSDQLIRHINRIIYLGGAKNICIGSDFDGIDRCIDGICDASDVNNIFDGLLRHNYPKKLINDISFNNVYNIFKKYEIYE